MNRRHFLLSGAALAASCTTQGVRPRTPFRLAICNETFGDASFAEGCRIARSTGFEGLEIAPFTLSEDPGRLAPARRRDLRRAMEGEGIRYVGLHWLLRAPKGLHVTTSDASLRKKSWGHVRRLMDLSADLGSGGALVFGSGKGRSAIDGTSRKDAVARFEQGLAALAPEAGARGVRILIEPLARPFSNILNTVDESAASVRRIGSPAIQTMIDCRQSALGGVSAPGAIRRHAAVIRHVHVNEKDGRHPGTGSFDFPSLFTALRAADFRDWVSVEVFRFEAGGRRIAKESIRHLRQVDRETGGAS